MCGVQSSHLLGHFTSNCCGCLDTRLMMQPGLEIILMSLLIRKNSKIANFHCPHNTKYTQKISIHSDSDVGQKYLSRLIIKILFPNSQKPRKHIYNKIYTELQYICHIPVAWPRDESWSGQVSVILRWFLSGGRGQVGQVAPSVSPDNYDSL